MADDDLASLARDDLVMEVMRLREGIHPGPAVAHRQHRISARLDPQMGAGVLAFEGERDARLRAGARDAFDAGRRLRDFEWARPRRVVVRVATSQR